MHKLDSSPEPLAIADFDALRRHEAQIVERIGQRANGGRLLVLDPLRLLKEVNVELSPEAVREWEKHAGLELREGSRNTAAYNAICEGHPQSSIRFRVRRILRGAA